MNGNNQATRNPTRRIVALLTPGERKKAGAAVAGVFVETLLEFAGIASLLPVLYYLLDDGGNGGNRRAAVLFGLFAFGVLAVKWAAGTALARRRNGFLLDVYRRMSLTLFTAYYRQGLLFIRERGTRRLGYEVNNACLAFSQGLLAPLLRMTGDGLLLLLAVLALLCWSPTLAGVLAVSFFPAALAYIAFIRKRVQDCGQREHEARRRQWDVTADAFAGYAELEVNDAAGKPLHSFGEGLDEVSRSRLELNMLGRLPGFISELSAVAGLVLVALSGSGGEVKVALGVFAVAAFRLLPALRSVMTGWTQVKNASFCLDILEKGLRPDAVRPPGATGGSRPLHFTRDIHFAHVSFRYPERAEPVLEDFCCTVRKGEYVGIRGASGAGKSTLFNLLLGFLVPDRGEVQVDGVPLSAENAASWRAQTGYVPQRVYIFNGTLAENIALGDPHPDRERIIRLLDELGMSDWLERQPAGPDTPLGEQGEKLSGGQRQRIGIARALYRDTSLLLLDEATSALDNESEQEVQATIARLRKIRPGLTILSVAHRDNSLKHCGRIITIKAGSRIKSVPKQGIMHDDSPQRRRGSKAQLFIKHNISTPLSNDHQNSMFYQIADISFRVEGDALTEAVARMDGFAPFAVNEKKGETLFAVRPGTAEDIPAGGKLLYPDHQYGVRTEFHALPAGGYLLDMQHEKGNRLRLWSTTDSAALCLAGTPAPQLLRFALWTGYGVMTARSRRIALHGSCIVAQGKAFLFLGESGTGKSTHTRLWREHVPGATLLNDDSPIVWAEDGEVWACGSPWSGKTPCYKPERYPLRGCVRLAQAPCNRMERLTGARAYAALHPSCPPAFAYDSRLYDAIGETLSLLLDRVPVYRLECRPDREAALLSFHTLCHE